jgi:rod shape-determining protein MreC
MRDFLRRIRLPLLFAALLLITTTLMVVDRRTVSEGGSDHSWLSGVLIEIAAPIQQVIKAPVDFLGETWTEYIALVDLRRDNEALRARVAALEEENLQFREALVASGNLERIVQMRENFEVPLLPSEVVGQDVFPWFRSILLDRGRSHDVLSGMPVVSDHGVVGLVTATSPHASRAMMLLDRQSAVDAIVQRSRARGIVRGRGTGELEFVFMVRGDDVQPGDVVITSGVGGVYPKGLRIGTITRVQTDEARLLHTGSVQPSVDFGRLEQVFIMLQRGPTMDLLYAGNGDEIGGRGDPESSRPSP